MLACDPSDAHALGTAIGIASERASAAAARAVYSSIITPESGPGSAARNGSSALFASFSSRLATNDRGCDQTIAAIHVENAIESAHREQLGDVWWRACSRRKAVATV